MVHPVVQLLHERRREIEKIKCVKGNTHELAEQLASRAKNFTTERNNVQRILPPYDGYRIALAIEGGGMRGCVTAGMVAAIHHLGLEDTIDVVYGSSAGTVIGAYFITRQLPWFGPEVYYDALTTAGDRFINTKRFLRAVGLGMLDPRLTKDVIFRRNHGKPVLDLSYLLKTTMQENKPLDWDTFERMQEVQPLKVMASGLKSQKAVIMDMERGSFRNLKELARCMHASCLLPGVAGPVMNLRKDNSTLLEPTMFARNKVQGEDYEPMADALMFEPLPFRPAISEGATHVICLRSRPDGVDVTGKSSLFERLIVRRFFIRKNKLQEAYLYMKKHLHKKRYAEDVIILNEAAHDLKRTYSDTSKPHLLPIAVPPGSPEVTRLETSREAIFEGVRRGFARAYDVLVEDVEQRGRGALVAKEVFPDDILDYDPVRCTSTSQSAYEAYNQGLNQREISSTSP
jgi:predicted acylesterase/phospholipase RssA